MTDDQYRKRCAHRFPSRRRCSNTAVNGDTCRRQRRHVPHARRASRRLVIPADRWRDNGDGTAWWIPVRCVDERAPQAAHWNNGDPCQYGARALDRPCDYPHDCVERHTFKVDVAVQTEVDAYESERIRVSVVPGMVLPLLEWTAIYDPDRVGAHVTRSRDGQRWTLFPPSETEAARFVTLPSAAEPGMWAVLLKVAT